MSKHIHHLIIALLAGVLIGLLLAHWLDNRQPPPTRPAKARRPMATKRGGHITPLYEDKAS